MKTSTRCADTDHNYQKFNESTVVCCKCAAQQTVTTLEAVLEALKDLPRPYVPCPHPHYPAQPYWMPPVIWGTSTMPYRPSDITYSTSA